MSIYLKLHHTYTTGTFILWLFVNSLCNLYFLPAELWKTFLKIMLQKQVDTNVYLMPEKAI